MPMPRPFSFRLAFAQERTLLTFKLTEELLSIDAFALVQRSHTSPNLGAKSGKLRDACLVMFFQSSHHLRLVHLTAQYHRNQSLSRPRHTFPIENV